MSELLAPEKPATEKPAESPDNKDILDWNVLTKLDDEATDTNEQEHLPWFKYNADTGKFDPLSPILDVDQPSTKLETPKFSDQETVDYITEKVSREREMAGPNEAKAKEMLTDVIDVLQDMKTALADPENELGGTDLIEHLIDEYTKGSEYYSDIGKQELANQSARRLIAATDLIEKYDGLKAQYELRHAQNVAVNDNSEEQPSEKLEPEDDPFADGYIA